MKPEEMTRSERIIELDNEIRDLGGVAPDLIARCEADHRSFGRTYLDYRIEMMDLLHACGVKQYKE